MKKWWMERIGYQIYPKSFLDTNNDGIGDLNGIKNKLPYLKDLGINLIWICPFYDSPMDDNGYDVRNFFDVSKDFGTLDDFKELLNEAKKLDIKVILDFVLNHTSDEHPWFIESRSNTFNEKRDYYIWQEGRIKDNKIVPPTNWASFFGGSAWEKDEITNMYYMKIFSKKMPDLNWKNKEVRKAMIEVGKWWLDLGIDGFRIDAVSHLSKSEFLDSNLGDELAYDWSKFSNLEPVHDYLKEMNEELFEKYDALTIGEVGGSASIDSALKYSSFDSKQLSMVFNFDHNWCNNLHEIKSYSELKTNVKQLKNVFNNWQTAFKDKGWLPLNWLNHDQPRLMSHYGDINYFKESGKMLATALYLMRGTPFVYQGEEIGMTNYPFNKFEDFQDVSSIGHYNSLPKDMPYEEKIWQVGKTSRDNARTPMQWTSGENAGFTTAKPWFKPNPNYKTINVESALKDKDSIWYHYQKIFYLRSKSEYKDLFVYGTYKQIDLENEDIYIYERELEDNLVIVINSFTKDEIKYTINQYEIEKSLLFNYNDIIINENEIVLRPYESVVLKVRRK